MFVRALRLRACAFVVRAVRACVRACVDTVFVFRVPFEQSLVGDCGPRARAGHRHRDAAHLIIGVETSGGSW